MHVNNKMRVHLTGEPEGECREATAGETPAPPKAEGEGEGQGPRTVYAAGKTCVDEGAAQRDGLLGKHAEVGCPQGKW